MRPYYPAAASAVLADQTFRDPPAEFRGVPFWSWNGALDRAQILEQMDVQRAMGMGAVQPHSRTGLITPYLGEEWMEHIAAVVDRAGTTGQRVWIYDEDRWPSGYAGGRSVGDPRMRAQHIRFSRRPPGPALATDLAAGVIAAYAIVSDARGRMVTASRLPADTPPRVDVWYAIHQTSAPTPWFNGTAYLDTLSSTAVRGFIDATHERYAQRLGAALGGTVAAFFTDEPAVTPFTSLASVAGDQDGIVAWTADLPATFRTVADIDILDRLPELFLDRADGAHAALRWRFHDHLADRFRRAFAGQIGAWCADHGVLSSGHLMSEDSLKEQHRWTGESMRHYRDFHLPGIDVLCDAFLPVPAKQASSVARQDGRAGVMSELYGVTDWSFSAAGHKRQGDWQAALGITVRVHHLAWFTMAGEAKRDYPASIDARLPWWREYPLVEDHFARVNAVLTRGEPHCRVAVLHPIESQWLLTGPLADQHAAITDLESGFQQVVQDLLHGLIDCDLIAESLLVEQGAAVAGKALGVGRMAYEAIVLPGLLTIRSTTLDLIEALADAGGRVVFVGAVPDLVDGTPSDRARRLAARCPVLPRSASLLRAAVDDWRDVAVATGNGQGIADCLHQMRDDGAERHLFLCCTRPQRALPGFPWDRDSQTCTVRLRGTWTVVENDTASGERRPIAHRHGDGWTEVPWTAGCAASLCLTLSPAREERRNPLPPARRWRRHARLAAPLGVERDEPNVLVLSLAQARLEGDDAWLPSQEIGRAENVLRARAGLPERSGKAAQPWSQPATPARHRVQLRFHIDAEATVAGARLALENTAETRATLDGQPLTLAADGWWIDRCLATTPLPTLDAGRHELILDQPLAATGTLEWAYLLGDFSVRASGDRAWLGAPPTSFTWGDLGRQGLPFFGGNATYRCRFAAPGGPLRLAVPWFEAPLLAVELDSRRVGRIAYDPYRLDLGDVTAGSHDLAITAFGHRRNHLGALHCRNPRQRWWGPGAWSPSGDSDVREWQVVPTGIMAAPCLEVPE